MLSVWRHEVSQQLSYIIDTVLLLFLQGFERIRLLTQKDRCHSPEWSAALPISVFLADPLTCLLQSVIQRLETGVEHRLELFLPDAHGERRPAHLTIGSLCLHWQTLPETSSPIFSAIQSWNAAEVE